MVYSYTPTGRRAAMTDVSGSTSYTYDLRDRLLTKTTPFGTLTYTYDAAGNPLSLKSSNSNGASMAYGYDALNRLATVTDASGVTSYTYDPVGNLSGYAYPNGVATSYVFDPLNRLTSMQSTCSTAAPGCGPSARTIASYAYTLGAAGNRLSVAELSGRTVQYGYDDLYRLTSETISGAASQNGAVSYQYDAVGNRKQLNSTVAAISTGLLNYDANDRISTQVYDNNGNTINNGVQNAYDFENHLIQRGNISIVYDGDGNRVSETVAGVTTNYLVADLNPTGYAQVVDELQSGAVTRSYTWGLELISQKLAASSSPLSFYGYDGHGSVRFLTDATGAITDTYDYDAFGNLISQTGTTANNYLFAGEQFDPALGVYYNRARYLDQRLGRFWSMDAYEGEDETPLSLHKYLYVQANPVSSLDPTGLTPIANLLLGQEVHVKIGEAFFKWTGGAGFGLTDATIKKILGVPVAGFSRFRPDLIDFRTHEIYEIKTINTAAIGYTQLAGYLIILNLADKNNLWVAGETFQHPALPATIDLGGGNVAIVDPPLEGVITYEVVSNTEILTEGVILLSGVAALAIKSTLALVGELGLDFGSAILVRY